MKPKADGVSVVRQKQKTREAQETIHGQVSGIFQETGHDRWVLFVPGLSYSPTPYSGLRFYKEQCKECCKAWAFLIPPLEILSVMASVRLGEVYDIFLRPCTAGEWDLRLSGTSAFLGKLPTQKCTGIPWKPTEVLLLDLTKQTGYCLWLDGPPRKNVCVSVFACSARTPVLGPLGWGGYCFLLCQSVMETWMYLEFFSYNIFLIAFSRYVITGEFLAEI